MKNRAPIRLNSLYLDNDTFEWTRLPSPPKKSKYSKQEKLAYQAKRRLHWLTKKWEREEVAFLRRRAELLAAQIELDRQKQLIEDERQSARDKAEAQLKQIKEYYDSAHAKEQAAEDKARREKLARITKELNADICRTERNELTRRGVVRGRK